MAPRWHCFAGEEFLRSQHRQNVHHFLMSLQHSLLMLLLSYG